MVFNLNKKRVFDLVFSFLGIMIVFVPLLLFFILSSLDTISTGIFFQFRIGQYGQPFTIYKLKTVNPKTRKISKIGRFLRKSKLDELPQLWNVITGDMSFVGPRPDIEGYADVLQGDDRIILTVKPGITGLASLYYRGEEQLLSLQSNPLHYNDTVIWPTKVSINKWYVENRTMLMDIQILFYTLFLVAFNLEKFISKKSS